MITVLPLSTGSAVEVPELLRSLVAEFLETHPDWDLNRLIGAAIALFLIQQTGDPQPQASKAYLKFTLPTNLCI